MRGMLTFQTSDEVQEIAKMPFYKWTLFIFFSQICKFNSACLLLKFLRKISTSSSIKNKKERLYALLQINTLQILNHIFKRTKQKTQPEGFRVSRRAHICSFSIALRLLNINVFLIQANITAFFIAFLARNAENC